MCSKAVKKGVKWEMMLQAVMRIPRGLAFGCLFHLRGGHAPIRPTAEVTSGICVMLKKEPQVPHWLSDAEHTLRQEERPINPYRYIPA